MEKKRKEAHGYKMYRRKLKKHIPGTGGYEDRELGEEGKSL